MKVYILYSESLDRYYTGFSLHPEKRLRQHRAEKGHWTSRAPDWKIVWSQKTSTTDEARAMEKKIKARGAKRFLQ